MHIIFNSYICVNDLVEVFNMYTIDIIVFDEDGSVYLVLFIYKVD